MTIGTVTVVRTEEEMRTAVMREDPVLEAPAALLEKYGCVYVPGMMTPEEEAGLVARALAGDPGEED